MIESILKWKRTNFTVHLFYLSHIFTSSVFNLIDFILKKNLFLFLLTSLRTTVRLIVRASDIEKIVRRVTENVIKGAMLKYSKKELAPSGALYIRMRLGEGAK